VQLPKAGALAAILNNPRRLSELLEYVDSPMTVTAATGQGIYQTCLAGIYPFKALGKDIGSLISPWK